MTPPHTDLARVASPQPKLRGPNAIDFWRGFALVTISIDHVPGNMYSHYTLGNFALSDAAELFVFLAGWAVRLVADSRTVRADPASVYSKLLRRAGEIYVAQILISLVAIAITALAAMALQAPFIYDWNAAGPMFEDPIRGFAGLVLLLKHLGYFDILPLYVVLILMSPLMIMLHRARPVLLLPASLILYALVLAFRLNLPTWPGAGHWFLNPFAWQLIFVLGFSLAGATHLGALARRFHRQIFWLSALIVAIGAGSAIAKFAPNPVANPHLRMFLLFDKTFLSPARIISMVALAAAFASLYPLLYDWARGPVALLSKLGRNSLNVFCVGSLASLVGQLYRYSVGGGVWNDSFILALTLCILWLTAWISEWRLQKQH